MNPRPAKWKFGAALCCAAALLFLCASPASANTSSDEVGAATTLYQAYLENNASGTISVKSNVSGTDPRVRTFIDDALDLSTRLVPFSLDANLQYYSSADPTSFSVTFRGREYNDLSPKVRSKAAEIANAASTLYQTDYEKLRYVNSYIIDHCRYLSEAVNDPDHYPVAFTAYGCLISGKAVCEGYANSVQLICEFLDIPCIKVTGESYSGSHVWNAVYLDKKWWMLDVTFNDPVGRQDSSDRWEYFLLNIDDFRRKGTHTFDWNSYETSKEIYTGRTVGQRDDVPLPYQGLSVEDAEAGDFADPNYLKDMTGVDDPTDIGTQPVSESTRKHAEALQALGLFSGDARGFRLEEAMTRVEMGVMVMRMNGGTAALAKNGAAYAAQCPFTDVPAWARGSIGYLYANKLTRGQSETLFGTGPASKRDYAVMMLRVLGIEHSYEDALAIAVTHGILTEAQAEGPSAASRGDIVDMTWATLELQKMQEQQTAGRHTA